MAEYFPGAPVESKPDEEKEKSGKKSKKKTNAANFAASLWRRGEETEPGQPKEIPKWDLLGNLAVKEEEAAEKKAAAAAEKPAKAPAKTKESAKKASDVEQLPEYQPKPVEFSGGEVIISLRGARPVVERDIPLQAAAAEKPAAETAPAAAITNEQQPPATAMPVVEAQMPGRQDGAHFESVVPGAPDAGPTPESGNGNVPPIDPPEGPPPAEGLPYEPPEEPRRGAEKAPVDDDSRLEPAEAWRRYMRQQELSRVEVQEVGERARNSGVRRFLTGLFTGAMYEHIVHRNREKRAEADAKKNRREVREARRDLRFNRLEQERRQAESDVRFAAAEQRFTGAEMRMQDREKQLEERIRLAEQAAAQVEQEQLKVAAGHKIEMSAWHAIETDRKTGKVVEKPSFEYGHEYYRERAQEAIPADQRNAVAGGVAILGAAARGADGTQDVAAGGPAAGQGSNVPNASTNRSTSGPGSVYGDTDTKSSAAIWPWLVVLIVVVISLIVALT